MTWQAVAFIAQKVGRGGNVFVHCVAGVSRSATVCIAYGIAEGLPFAEAYRRIKAARGSVRPNPGFVDALRDFERRVVARGGGRGRAGA